VRVPVRQQDRRQRRATRTLQYSRIRGVKGLTMPPLREAGAEYASHGGRPARSPRVLVLTSGLGSGHARAGEAITRALRLVAPDVQVRQLDFWSLMNPGVAATIQRKYLELVLEHPDLYARLHALDERTWRRVIENQIAPPGEVIELIELVTRTSDRRSLASVVEWALGPYPSDLLLYPTACAALPTTPGERAGSNVALLRLALLRWGFLRLQGRMSQRLEAFEPDVVVATQMVPAALVSALKQESPRWRDLPLVGVLTDFGAHDYWAQPGVDLYCVPHDSVAGPPLVADAEEACARVAVTGVPLMPGFESVPPVSEARRWIGIDAHDPSPVVLVLGGGLGLGLEATVGPLLAEVPDCRVVVMAGHNDAALLELRTLAAEVGPRLVVRGWTEHMENYIAAADLVIGKPGGLTVAEVLACGRPLLVTKSLQGQESFNVKFIERHDVGRLVSRDGLPAEARRWLADRKALDGRQHRAATLGRREGALEIADYVLAYADAAVSDWADVAPQGAV
jgi:processive 1,2-diacylglycerol beta-glucosyltransferase